MLQNMDEEKKMTKNILSWCRKFYHHSQFLELMRWCSEMVKMKWRSFFDRLYRPREANTSPCQRHQTETKRNDKLRKAWNPAGEREAVPNTHKREQTHTCMEVVISCRAASASCCLVFSSALCSAARLFKSSTSALASFSLDTPACKTRQSTERRKGLLI